MSIRKLLHAGLSAAILLSTTAAAPAVTYEAIFDFRISGLKAGEVVTRGEYDSAAYRATARVDTAGLVGIFATFFYDGVATGRIAGDRRVVPERFDASSRSPRADRETRIVWQNGTPVDVSVEPPRATSPDPASQSGTLDPVSAGFALLRDGARDEICAAQVDVFDGSRRSRITLGSPRSDGQNIVCNGSYERLEGEEQSFNSSDAYGFRVIFREADAGYARIHRIETNTQFGPASLTRR